MGKLTLLLVTAAALGASLLTFSTHTTVVSATDEDLREEEYSTLARANAISAQSYVLDGMLTANGFALDIDNKEGPLPNGSFLVNSYSMSNLVDGMYTEVDFTVTGYAGGASHTINSSYELDIPEFPGPLWMDVPFAAFDLDTGMTIDGGSEAKPAYYDPRLFLDNNLQDLLDAGALVSDAQAAFSSVQGNGAQFVVKDLEANGLLEDVNVSTAYDLYWTAKNAYDPSSATDLLYSSSQTFSSSQLLGSSDRIVVIEGDLTVDSGATLRGKGALVVAGNVTVDAGAELDWEGLVIVRSDSQTVDLHFDGDVTIEGSLVISQEAMPPGGHMDVTTTRAIDGTWPDPRGEDLKNGTKPFHKHRHRYDESYALYNGGEPLRTLHFLNPVLTQTQQNALDNEVNFLGSLDEIGEQLIALEFDHFANSHGHARWTLDLDGDSYMGSVKKGFGDAAFSADAPYRTQWFLPSQLEEFTLEIQSLRALKQGWDAYPSGQSGELCYPDGPDGSVGMWPGCVGRFWDRGDALTVRIVRQSDGASLYENATYWHLRGDELAEHIEEEDEWRDDILNGAAYGTSLRTSSGVSFLYHPGNIKSIGERLAFDPDALIHRSSGSVRVNS